jgi:starvation-inducible DNA-binding protein
MRPKTSSAVAERLNHHPIQAFSEVSPASIALPQAARHKSIENLNQLLADTLTLRDLYKKHHWQVSGPQFYQLHLLFDKHAGEQSELADALAERVQTLGGVSLAAAHDVVETTIIPRPPRDRESPADQFARLLHAHEVVLEESRSMARAAADAGDDGTNDLVVSDVIRTNEMQAWFISEHLRGVEQ